mmetsp:Transcript_8684/g.21368  ORF Transcript_8684/g.21368 Transcript_8684/m.21368 type:complete len:329 (-) Transcript_8684:249-1235(-)
MASQLKVSCVAGEACGRGRGADAASRGLDHSAIKRVAYELTPDAEGRHIFHTAEVATVMASAAVWLADVHTQSVTATDPAQPDPFFQPGSDEAADRELFFTTQPLNPMQWHFFRLPICAFPDNIHGRRQRVNDTNGYVISHVVTVRAPVLRPPPLLPVNPPQPETAAYEMPLAPEMVAGVDPTLLQRPDWAAAGWTDGLSMSGVVLHDVRLTAPRLIVGEAVGSYRYSQSLETQYWQRQLTADVFLPDGLLSVEHDGLLERSQGEVYVGVWSKVWEQSIAYELQLTFHGDKSTSCIPPDTSGRSGHMLQTSGVPLNQRRTLVLRMCPS